MIKENLAIYLIRFAKAIAPGAWAKEVTASANSVAVTATMAYLDKMGFDHCCQCAQTQGLFNISGRAYCHKHKPKTMATAWAIN